MVNLADLRSAALKLTKKHHVLVHVHGTELGRVRTLGEKSCLLGRAADADVWIGDDGVSRKHALIVPSGGGYAVEDLGSANGTFVQGSRVTRHELVDGDQIQLGPTAVFRYSITDEDQKNLLEQLYSTSVTDALTGAKNREYLDSVLVTEISYSRRHDGDLSFVLFDLDHFKKVNDTYGHPAGDTVLVEVTKAVRQVIRAEDYLCRYGGEEFGIVLRAIDLEGAAVTAERIRVVIENLRIRHEELELTITASLGCASIRELPEPTPALVIELADKRLYVAKHGGRNRVVSS